MPCYVTITKAISNLQKIDQGYVFLLQSNCFHPTFIIYRGMPWPVQRRPPLLASGCYNIRDSASRDNLIYIVLNTLENLFHNLVHEMAEIDKMLQQ